MNCLTNNLSPQLEHCFKGFVGKRPACFAGATYPNTRRGGEMGETRHRQLLSQVFFPKEQLLNYMQIVFLACGAQKLQTAADFPANFPLPFFSPALLWSSDLLYIAADLSNALSCRRHALTPTRINRQWINFKMSCFPTWSLHLSLKRNEHTNFIKTWTATNWRSVSLYYFKKYALLKSEQAKYKE